MRAARPLRNLHAEDGQSLVEYALITSIVSIVGVVLLGAIGSGVNLDLSQALGGF